jgi:putative ABC transport system permease protein
MGLSVGRIIGMLVFEQLLISGFAVMAGLLIGTVASDLFVPLLQIVYSAQQQVPPFRVVASRTDYLRVYAVVTVMLFTVMAVLAALITRIRVYQAIKLGEE